MEIIGTDPQRHQQAPPARHHLSVFLLILATLFWGLSFPLSKAAFAVIYRILGESTEMFSTVLTVAARCVIGAVLLLLVSGKGGLPRRRIEWIHGAVLGVFCGIGMLFQMLGLQRIEASVSAFITQCYVIILPLLVWLLQGRKPGPVVWLCIVLVMGGTTVLAGVNTGTLKISIGMGEGMTLLSTLFFAGQIYWIERPVFKEVRVRGCTSVMLITMGLFFSLALMMVDGGLEKTCQVLPSIDFWITVLPMILFCTVGAFTLMNGWQRFVTATEAGLIYCFEPVFASLFALFLPVLVSAWTDISYANEIFTTKLLAGGGLILLANLILQVKGE